MRTWSAIRMVTLTPTLVISLLVALVLAPPAASTGLGGPLAQMSQQERENTEITLVLDDTGEAIEQARELADRVEQLWNGGNYEQALSRFNELVALVGLQKIDVSGDLRVPRVTSSRVDRSPDVQISASDSVYDVELCVHQASGNLFAALLLMGEGAPSTIRTYHSTDGGATWTETFWTNTGGWWESISCEVKGDYYYMAMNKTSSGRILLMRFSVSDGQHVDFPIAGSYVTIAALTLEDIKLTCPDHATIQLWLVGNDASHDLHLIYGLNTLDAGDWYVHATNIDDVDRGLDAVSGETAINSRFYDILVSYYSSSDSFKIVGYDYGDILWEQLHVTGSVTSECHHTSISKHGDTVACLSELQPGLHVNVYVWSSTGGGFGLESLVSDTAAPPYASWVPVIQMGGGGGVGVCFLLIKTDPPQFVHSKFAYAPYHRVQYLQFHIQGSYAENVPITIVAPDIESFQKGRFGVVYVTMHFNFQAYFSRVDCCNGDGIRGNVDGVSGAGGEVDVADLTYVVAHLFGTPSGPAPLCEDEGNVDGLVSAGGPTDVADLTYLVAYLFLGGPAPAACP